MDILLWNTSYLQARGGAETHVHLLLNELARHGLSVGVVANRPEAATATPPLRSPLHPAVVVHADRFPYPFGPGAPGRSRLATPWIYLGSIRRLIGFLRRHTPAVVNLRYVNFDAVPLVWLQRRCGYRLVLTFSGGDVALAERNRLARWRIGFAVRRAGAVTAVSEDLCRRVERLYGRPVRCLPNGVEPAAQTPLPAPSESDAFVFCGRLVAVKRLPFLLRAYAACVRRGIRTRLRIVGSGPEAAALERLVQELGIGDRVEFLGGLPHDQALAELARGRALVLTSASEGLPMVALEAMARARPVVASRVGGLPELITDGVEGWLFPPDQPEALIDRLMALDADPSAADRAGQLGRHRVEATFSIDRMVENYLDLYDLRILPGAARP